MPAADSPLLREQREATSIQYWTTSCTHNIGMPDCKGRPSSWPGAIITSPTTRAGSRSSLSDTFLATPGLMQARATLGSPVATKEKTDEIEQKEFLERLLMTTFSIYMVVLYPWIINAYPSSADVVVCSLISSIGDVD